MTTPFFFPSGILFEKLSNHGRLDVSRRDSLLNKPQPQYYQTLTRILYFPHSQAKFLPICRTPAFDALYATQSRSRFATEADILAMRIIDPSDFVRIICSAAACAERNTPVTYTLRPIELGTIRSHLEFCGNLPPYTPMPELHTALPQQQRVHPTFLSNLRLL